jgi:purine catabolism regulator
VADAAEHLPARGYHRLEDARLRGLLHLLRDDARLHTFIDRELGPLLALPPDRGRALLDVLDALLGAGGNKVAAAAALHLSRPALYDRIARLEQLLGVDLADAESRTSLHVALLAHAATHPSRAPR